MKEHSMPPYNAYPFNWVPTGHKIQTALDAYLKFRSNFPPKDDRASFLKWCQQNYYQSNSQAYQRTTLQTFCFPLASTEFDIFGRPLQEVETIAIGGSSGLEKAYGSLIFAMPSQRIKVCLVDTLITGLLYQNDLTPAERNKFLVQRNYAGTPQAAQTLLAVGRSVGQHFHLLNEDFLPTELFHIFFANCLLHWGSET